MVTITVCCLVFIQNLIKPKDVQSKFLHKDFSKAVWQLMLVIEFEKDFCWFIHFHHNRIFCLFRAKHAT